MWTISCSYVVTTLFVFVCVAGNSTPESEKLVSTADQVSTDYTPNKETEQVTNNPEKNTSQKEKLVTGKITDMDGVLCQRRPLTVKFADLKWDHRIVAPFSYDAGYCSGDCPYDKLPNTTNHAVVQALVNSFEPLVPRPCCVPVELEPLSFLVITKRNDVVLRNYTDMKVKSCGCL